MFIDKFLFARRIAITVFQFMRQIGIHFCTAFGFAQAFLHYAKDFRLAQLVEFLHRQDVVVIDPFQIATTASPKNEHCTQSG